MNKSKIEWCDYTWNPVTGCLHGCDYCYARRIAERFKAKSFAKYEHMYSRDCTHDLHVPKIEGNKVQPFPAGFQPTFHRYRLDEPLKLKKRSKIFVCSMADLFGEWVPDEWIYEVMSACWNSGWNGTAEHKFLFLTKNPKRIKEWEQSMNIFLNSAARPNMWFGTTITGTNDFARVRELPEGTNNTFISIEPLLEPLPINEFAYYLYKNGEPFHREPRIYWVIVGAQTGPGSVPPKPEWVQSIIDQCRVAGVPVFLKNNLNWPEKIQEFPDGLR